MDKPGIALSINPTYYCNMSCNWCYLTPEQLADKNKVDLSTLRDRLETISEYYRIDQVDIYGGEVTLLPKNYQRDLIDMIEDFDPLSINVVTNFTAPDAPILELVDSIAVSYDGVVRENHERVLENLMTTSLPYAILVLVSREFLDKVSADQLVSTLELLGGLTVVEIKPYSSNQSNQQEIDYTEYERFVLDVINHPSRTFDMNNIRYIKNALAGTNNTYSDDHLYITPTGEMAVLDFDSSGNEYFRTMVDLSEFREWSKREVIMTDEGLCGTCEYRGHCLSEHLKVVRSLDRSCNGFYNLLKEFDNADK